MNEIAHRRHLLNQARAALHQPSSRTTESLLIDLGRCYRIGCTDAEASDEAAALVAEADLLLDGLKQALQGRDLATLRLPPLDEAHRWLASPRTRHGAVLDAFDRHGAVQAALSLLAPDSEPHRRASAEAAEALGALQIAAVRAPEAILELTLSALERIVLAGVVPGEDPLLLALDDLARRHLASALQGQPLPAPTTIRVRPLDAAQAEALGNALALAMQRSRPLQVAPDLLELADFPAPPAGSRRSFDLRLHNAPQEGPRRESIELLQDVQVTVTEEEIEVEFQGDPHDAVLLVPLHQGQPGEPCPVRSGNHPRHLIFSPPAPLPDAPDGYALVIGDRLAVLRR
ncbi:MAG: hypothetical protein MUF64_19185 [Polyangiaceae bacterium]|nr:hypothetical protein [Polyangiaceae bacterium]